MHSTSVDYDQLLSGAGPFRPELGDVEERPGQTEMARAVDRVITGGGRMLIEAGTGIGKTLAYLLPSVLHASPARRIVISTATLTLQQQIHERDLPMVQRALGCDRKSAVVFGRENYLCRRRLEAAYLSELRGMRDHPLDAQSGASRLEQLSAILRFSRERRGGIREQLSRPVRGDVWRDVCAERGNCLSERSPFHAQCGWQDALRDTRDAAILIVNHALLIADLVQKRTAAARLAPFSTLILDEAHHLESVAAEQLGCSVSLDALRSGLRSLEILQFGRSALSVVLKLQQCRAQVAALKESLQSWLAGAAHREIEAVVEPAAALARTLEPVLSELRDVLAERFERGGAAEDLETQVRSERLQDRCGELLAVASGSTCDTVRWIERVDADCVLRSAPLEPGRILGEQLHAGLHGVIATSATLSIPGVVDPFEFMRAALGLDTAESMRVESSFAYRDQVEVYIDASVDPGSPAGYVAALVERLPSHCSATRGRVLVLFTSRRTLEEVAAQVRDALERRGFELFVQGERDGRTELLRRFLEQDQAVLFGLASFWEGVDLPGALAQVILTRLPFRVPNHPIEKARARRVAEAGGDPFRSLSLPQAVLRFRQGFGRLIRRASDRGRVTIMDGRVLRRDYGQKFLQALPECRRFLLQGDESVPWDGSETLPT